MNKSLNIARQIANYVEKELGGTVTLSDDGEHGLVIFVWKKYNEKTKQVFRYEQKVSYEAIESVTNVSNFGQKVVNQFKKNSKKEMGNGG